MGQRPLLYQKAGNVSKVYQTPRGPKAPGTDQTKGRPMAPRKLAAPPNPLNGPYHCDVCVGQRGGRMRRASCVAVGPAGFPEGSEEKSISSSNRQNRAGLLQKDTPSLPCCCCPPIGGSLIGAGMNSPDREPVLHQIRRFQRVRTYQRV